jgi:hypothetical protein
MRVCASQPATREMGDRKKMGSKKRAPPKAEEPDYQPTERALAALRQLAEVEPTPRVKVTKGSSGAPVLAPDHRDQMIGYALLAKAIGTSDYNLPANILYKHTN